MAAPDTLLIDHGDLPSLALFALQPDPSRLIVWHPQSLIASQLAAVRLHAKMAGKHRPVVADHAVAADEPQHLYEVKLLLSACSAALREKCNRILWPICVGADHLRIADALERAATIAHLADPSGSLLLDAPIVDLTYVQLVELTEEAGAPIRAFWPCHGDGAQPCGSCPGCDQWRSAFNEAGIRWPWASAGARALQPTGT